MPMSGRRASPGGQHGAEGQADDDAGQRDDVGQQVVLEVDGKEHDQRGREHAAAAPARCRPAEDERVQRGRSPS